MDGPRFDTWTRRRFGLAAGGAVTALAGWRKTGAKKRKGKHKKKRCRKLLQRCTPGGKRTCCGQLRCDFHTNNAGIEKVCCKTNGKSCQNSGECCVPLACNVMTSQCAELLPSDRAIKANFGSVDPADMLERVRSLPISTWNYTSDDPFVRHIGPMAQDFATIFGVGADDRHIHPLDGQGVALAAIQGLLDEITAVRQENSRLAARVAALEERGR